MSSCDACKIEWLVIPAPDLEKAKEFYSSVFGWEISEFSPDFWIFKSGTLSGGLSRGMEPAEEGVTFSITVDDILTALDRIETVGGIPVRGKYEIGGGFGFSAVFRDPNGNLLELWAEK